MAYERTNNPAADGMERSENPVVTGRHESPIALRSSGLPTVALLLRRAKQGHNGIVGFRPPEIATSQNRHQRPWIASGPTG